MNAAERNVRHLLLLLLLQTAIELSHSVAVVLTLVQTKQIRINVHKQNNTKHSTNNTKHSTYQYTYYQTPTHYKTS